MYHAVVPLFNGYGAARKSCCERCCYRRSQRAVDRCECYREGHARFRSITDMNGHYSITMEPYRQLVFTYIGYESKEVMVKEQRTITLL